MTKTIHTLLKVLVIITSLLFCTYSHSQDTQQVNGRNFSSYKIKPGDTWTGLARKYHIPLKELQQANSGVPNLKAGYVIMVPSTTDYGNIEKSELQSTLQPLSNTPVYHTVVKGETLYRISKIHNQSLDDIKKWNKLTSNNITLGKKLIVGYGSKERPETKNETPPVIKEKAKLPVEEVKKPLDTASVKHEPIEKAPKVDREEIKTEVPVKSTEPLTPGSVEKVTETGVATWLNDQELNQNKFYALHRTAPVGTIIKVTNRMNNNSVFVKVVGALPDTGDNKNIIIKITPAAAQRIGAIDQKFTAELSYGITH